MTEVFYRKWRPRRLDEVVGQEVIAQTLRNEVTMDRIAHAYLFCGPRGTGKTSTARIMAKAVNCLTPEDGEPDNKCGVCCSINEGRAIDLVEIDAASNRGIDDIRNLREKVHFVPNETRYKIYIVDEVHMLTKEAFSALLKTLEEPPGHVIFVLATTEVHKIPLTIISRCQRFDFRRIPLDTIAARLAQLCRDEAVEADEGGLLMLARTADGSLRDAENLLEQALVSYGSPLREKQVRDLLELDTDERALELVGHVLGKDVRDGLGLINDMVADGGDLRQLHRGATEYLRGALLLKSGAGSTLDYAADASARVNSMVGGVSLDQIVRALKLFSTVDVRGDVSSSLPLELAVVEACQEPGKSRLPEKPLAAPAAVISTPRRSDVQLTRPSLPDTRVRSGTPVPEARPSVTLDNDDKPLPSEASDRLESQWSDILRALSRHKGKRFNLGALLRDCRQREVTDGVINLRFFHTSHKERMESELEDLESGKVLRDALSKAMDMPVKVVVSIVSGHRGTRQNVAQKSHLVRAAQAMGARVVDEKEDDSEQKNDSAGPAAAKEHDENAG